MNGGPHEHRTVNDSDTLKSAIKEIDKQTQFSPVAFFVRYFRLWGRDLSYPKPVKPQKYLTPSHTTR
jgi:hypothetical protein